MSQFGSEVPEYNRRTDASHYTTGEMLPTRDSRLATQDLAFRASMSLGTI